MLAEQDTRWARCWPRKILAELDACPARYSPSDTPSVARSLPCWEAPGHHACSALGVFAARAGALVVPPGFELVPAGGHGAPARAVRLAAVDQEQGALLVRAWAQPPRPVPVQRVPGDHRVDQHRSRAV